MKSIYLAFICFLTLNLQAQLSGTFTIDQNSSASSTNFISFNQAVDALEANGLNGNVTIQVTSNSGPYSEQVTLPNIGGSNSYQLTIDGNGEELNFNQTTAKGQHVFCFDSAQNVILRNLTIRSLSYTNTPIGIEIRYGSQDIQIENNTIQSATTSDRDQHFSIGISLADSVYIPVDESPIYNDPAYITPKPTRSKNIIIKKNTIKNSMFGILAYYDTSFAISNMIEENKIEDFVYFGIADFGSNDVIQNNEITRPNMGHTIVGYHIVGIFAVGGYDGSVIKVHDNYIHDFTGEAGSFGLWGRSAIRSYSNYRNHFIAFSFIHDKSGKISIDNNIIDLKESTYSTVIDVFSNDDVSISNNHITFETNKNGSDPIEAITSGSLNGKQVIYNNYIKLNYKGNSIGLTYPLTAIEISASNDSCRIVNNIISYDVPNIAYERVSKRYPNHPTPYIGNLATQAISCFGSNTATFDILYNTIHFESCNTDTLIPVALCLRKGNYSIINNIISMDNLGRMGRVIKSIDSSNWTASHNAIYYKDSLAFNEDSVGMNSYNLTSFNTRSGGQNLLGYPQFVDPGNGDFRPASLTVLNKGIPLSSVIDDFHGNPRNPTTPDIGAIELVGNDPVSVDKVDIPNPILYPNPTSSSFSINTWSGINSVEVYNNKGQLVHFGNSRTVELQQNPLGIYLVRISTENSTTIHKIVLK
ncbi:MAG: T9SS type A sorting domain-containing protein [Bacteroidia bacterium]|nr:T9SS type A sorting domain-containing protein [Bacteroidia bacterium]